jgi:hypothetical protein
MGAIDTSYTFTATDVITSTKMNNILDQSTITETAIIGSTLAVTTGKLFVKAGGITSNELAVGAVTTTALTDLNVTTGKIADLGVTTGKINDLSVTFLKLATDAVATVAEAKAQTASKLVTADNVKQSPPSAKAYGSFTAATSTRTLSGAYNIASATRIDLDQTAIAFTSPMASSGYTVLCQTTNSGSTGTATILLSENPTVYNKTTTGFKIVHSNESTSRAVDFVVFGTLA